MLSDSSSAPHLSCVTLRVRDPERSAEFYRAVLGIDVVPLSANGAGGAREMRGSTSTLTGFKIAFTEGLPPGDHLTGLDRVSFEVASRESVDHIYKEATTRHARATQPRLYEGHWQIFIFDPDGYKVEVFTRTGNGPTGPPVESNEH